MKKTFAAILTVFAISSSAFALVSQDRVVCSDQSSNRTYQIKILDIGDESAEVRVRRAAADGGNYSYVSKDVVFDEYEGGATFTMLYNGYAVEVIEVPDALETQGHSSATYTDRDGSHAIACKLVR